ncbi:UNVERIFIED_CONTAM: hypothetical protein FKN15_071093 [Acipenser sinensis]
MNTCCPPRRVPSAARFFTLCRLTVKPPQSYSVGGQRSSGQLTGKPAGARPDYRGNWCTVHRCNPLVTWETEAETCPPKRVPANLSFFALRIISEATRPIVPEDNTDLNVSTADPQAPCQPQGSLVRGEPWIALPTKALPTQAALGLFCAAP